MWPRSSPTPASTTPALGLLAALLVGALRLGVAALPAAPTSAGWRPGRAGSALVLVASLPFMERLAEESFTGHMVQHLVVIVLAAPLLVLAEPIAPLTRSGTRARRPPRGRRLGRVVAAWARRRRAAGVRRPCCSSPTSRRSTTRRCTAAGVHELEHAGYLLGAVLTWAAVLGRAARRAPSGASGPPSASAPPARCSA